MSIFDTMVLQPDDPILGLSTAFKADSRKDKVNLGVGAYKDSEGQPYVLETVKKAEELILKQDLPKEYGPIEGNPEFRDQTLKLIFGDHFSRLQATCSLQTLGATGALRVGAGILQEKGATNVFVSDPSWPNHFSIFERSGFDVETYPYYDSVHHTLLFEQLCQKVMEMERGSVMLLQGPCHNPTGCDPTNEQWNELSQVVKKQGVIPFFDVAYLGFGVGLEEDAYPIRRFADDGHEMFVAFSYSKNMGLYGERIGALAVLTESEERAKVVLSHAKQVVRSQYSMPPLYAARIVATVLSDSALRKEWMDELTNIRTRIQGMRAAFAAGLMTKAPGKDLTFMEKQKGMFSFCGIDRDGAMRLREEFGIYLPLNGRVNVAGLTSNNIDYAIDSIASVFNQS